MLSTVCSWLARFALAEAAPYLLRYQTSRLVFVVHTTTAEARENALAAAIGTVRVALEPTLGSDLDAATASQARRPVRHGGLGIMRLSRKPRPGPRRSANSEQTARTGEAAPAPTTPAAPTQPLQRRRPNHARANQHAWPTVVCVCVC